MYVSHISKENTKVFLENLKNHGIILSLLYLGTESQTPGLTRKYHLNFFFYILRKEENLNNFVGISLITGMDTSRDGVDSSMDESQKTESLQNNRCVAEP